jgi:hypothetical protein
LPCNRASFSTKKGNVPTQNQDRFLNFRAALRQLGAVSEIAERLGVSQRSVKYYLAGSKLPKADIVLRFPALTDALRRDVEQESVEQVGS